MTRVLAIVAARDEADRVGDTVAALRSLGSVAEVVVVVDGSRDGTARVAVDAGARVLARARGVGKGGALDAAVELVPPADVYLFADGDLGASAGGLGPVLRPVLDGEADLAVAILPRPPRGGFGLVKGAARRLIRAISGFDAVEPLSGQRAIRREALEACRPLAAGFGVEAGMTADAVRLGFRVVEVPAALEHRFTGRDLAGFRHRARQGWDVVRAAVPRLLLVR